MSTPASMPSPTRPVLVLLLGDQLSASIASLRDQDPARTVVLMAEVMEEATYVAHHVKKIAFLFSAMRHFAAELERSGWIVRYTKLDDPGNAGSLLGEVERAVVSLRPGRLVLTEPGEWRLLDAMKNTWSARLGLPVDLRDDDRFICTPGTFRGWARGRRQFRMEHFYREMRRQTGLLMDGSEPCGGQWNYDADNRKPAKGVRDFGSPLWFEPDQITREVLALVASRFGTHPGRLEPFRIAVTREQAEQALEHFLDHALDRFGDYQDAMVRGNPFLFHSFISPYLNAGLLDPLAVCQAAEARYRAGRAPLNAVEGFVRQILGWREYVRGVYWLSMPDYVNVNHFKASRPLPAFYWSGDTDMACMRDCIAQTMEHAYAHHIQRLMVTGTFALLAGINPVELHEWYLAVYADAYEWVEMPNTIGMSQFADGGRLASKPYAASGNYINKMSDYCKGCRYDVKQKSGEDACPFNYLYWDFMDRNQATLGSNPRLGPVYRLWEKMEAPRQEEVRESARRFLSGI